MIVGLFRADLPFVDGAATAFGSDAILGCEMFGEQPVRLRQLFEERKAPRIALRHNESGLDE